MLREGNKVDVGLVGCKEADFIREIYVLTKMAGDHVRCSLYCWSNVNESMNHESWSLS
jgi:hypothetical protein